MDEFAVSERPPYPPDDAALHHVFEGGWIWVLRFRSGIVSAGVIAFAFMTSNPFLRLLPAPADGNDLNPLLQDPGMIFHPPTLYVGYVGMAVPFAIAVPAPVVAAVVAPFAAPLLALDAVTPQTLGSDTAAQVAGTDLPVHNTPRRHVAARAGDRVGRGDVRAENR